MVEGFPGKQLTTRPQDKPGPPGKVMTAFTYKVRKMTQSDLMNFFFAEKSIFEDAALFERMLVGSVQEAFWDLSPPTCYELSPFHPFLQAFLSFLLFFYQLCHFRGNVGIRNSF